MQITETQPQPKRIVINLDSEDRAKVFKAGERLQVSAYEAVCRSLKTSMEFAEQLATQLSEYGQPSDQTIKPIDRIHNAIFVDGERGTGKTAFMLNLEEAYRQTPGVARNSLFFCQPIDPTLLSIKEDFINVIIGQLHREVEHLLQHKSETMPEDYVESLEQVVDCLESGQTAKSSYGVDRLLAFKGSLELELRLYDYFAKTKKVLGCKAIVLPIDDVDMSLDVAFNVLEVIRKYLASPFVLPVVSGDKKLYQDIVSRHFIHKLAVNEKSPSNDEFDNSAALALKYLQKIFPEHSEIKLKAVREIAKQIDIRYKPEQKLELGFNELYTRLKRIIFAKATHVDRFWTDFTPITARDLVQLTGMLDKLSTEVKDDLFAQDKDQAYKLAGNIELLEALTNYFRARGKEALVKSLVSTIELLDWQNQQTEQSIIRDITLFHKDALITKSDTNHFANKCLEQLNKARVGPEATRIQTKYFKTLKPLLINYPAVEPYYNDVFIPKGSIKNVQDKDSKLMLALYTHQNYHSSSETRYLIFFGKAFEFIATSLYRDLNVEDVKNLLNKTPLHSFFHYFATKTVIREREEEIEGSDENTDADIKIENDEYLSLTNKINEWRKALGTPPPNAFQLFFIFDKYMNDVTQLKNEKFLKGQTLDSLNQRVKFILSNAAASFEIASELLVSQAIALGNKFNIENIKSSDSCYRNNIMPLLSCDSKEKFKQAQTLTEAIYWHPIFDLSCDKDIKISASQNVLAKKNPVTKPQKISDDETKDTSNSRLARRALKKVISEDKRNRLESIDQYNFEKHVDFIANIVNLITSSDAMTEQRATYQTQKEDKRSLFGQIYHLASQGGMSDLLDKWLNE